MISKEIQAIQERLRLSSSGEWSSNGRGHLIIPVSNRLSRHIHIGDTGQSAADVNFLKHAPTDIKALLSEVERQDRELTRLQNELNIAKQQKSNAKQQTLKEAIELIKTVYLPTPSARDAMTATVKLLKEFKNKSFESYVIRQNRTRGVF